MRFLIACLFCFIGFESFAQSDSLGIVMGNVLDEKSKALEGATVQLIGLKDSQDRKTLLTDKDGAFALSNIPFGYYRLRVTYVGLQPMMIDSIHFRAERYDFNLNDIVLKAAGAQLMDEIVVYAEKPLIQSKDGNLTFNAGESALSAGSNASELLTSVPLITKDPDGKLLVRGKEPRILIDDKPVELNLQQLQDLLESMPGSSIEKIEVMTNPPPQYANEQGGVINIVTKKGSVGKSGRLSVYGGTRGEAGGNASFNYRRRGFSININSGAGFNSYEGNGYSKRQNLYADSTNYFNTLSNYQNKNVRPNFRANINYDLNKFNSVNLVLQYNQNDFDNRNFTQYTNLNRMSEVYKLSERVIKSAGDSYNPNVSFSYTLKTKKPGESLKLIGNINSSSNQNTRDFVQQYFNPDHTPTGSDSVQQQINDNRSRGRSLRLNYDLPLSNNKTFLSFGSFYGFSQSDISADATYKRSADNSWVALDALTNNFRYRQSVKNLRGSVKQVLGENFSATAGINAEETFIRFDLFKTASDTTNSYWSFLPFVSLNKNWNDVLNLSFSYRRTIRRPGINELNPTIDFSDPYNIRFGNPGLLASFADNFDLVLGRTKNSFYANIGMGYNKVSDIFAQVRTLNPDGKTQITWQNISGRKEYEMSTWNGYTVSKHTKVNLSASYTYNTYSAFDKVIRKYRNGGSLSSHLSGNYTWKDLYTATGSFTFNHFANPQGTVKSSLSMNIGLQAKLLHKKMTVTLNIIDPFVQQQNRSFTYGTNFNLESYSTTQTRNFRLTLGYNLSKAQKKKPVVSNTQAVQKLLEKS
jgi:outer membrane receptor protein involved in Fe transport